MRDDTAANAKPQIMIVDDMEVNQVILAKMIESIGLEPMLVDSAAQALELLKESLPQMFLLDITMPQMSGFELCEILKKDVRTREIPVIFITASTEIEDRITGFGLGGVDFITKPFVLQEVIARVRTHMEFYEMKRKIELYEQKLRTLLNE